MNSNKGKQRFFVIYQITNLLNNHIYVGAHTTFNVDDKYMGSSKYLKKDLKELGRQNFKKEILHIFDTKEDMIKMETKIVNKEFCHRIDTYNRMVGGIADWSVLGMVPVKDENNNKMLVYKDDPRYLSGELIGMHTGNNYTKGTITVKNKNGEFYKVSVTDERYLSGELVGINTGFQHPNSCWNDKKHKEESKRKIGLANSEKQKGELNSQYGTCWITKEGINKKIKKEQLDEWIIQGWSKGRK